MKEVIRQAARITRDSLQDAANAAESRDMPLTTISRCYVQSGRHDLVRQQFGINGGKLYLRSPELCSDLIARARRQVLNSKIKKAEAVLNPIKP
eukprot:9995560-Karenia_brevis.AAC.1